MFLKLELTPNDIPDELSVASVGQRMIVAVSEIGDMDEDVGSGDRDVQIAGILCRTPGFQEFMVEYVRERASSPVRAEPTEDFAARTLKKILGIDSRAELRDNEAAQKKFNALKIHYDDWLLKNGDGL